MKAWKYIFGLLILVTFLIWLAVFSLPDNNLHLIACDVGQGDAILVTYKSTQVLVDGGPDNKVLDCLSRHLPFWDRQLELIILTHPQKDHYQGLIEVVRRYKVDNFLYNGLDSGNDGYQLLKREVGGQGIRVIHTDRGTSMRLDMMYLDVVHPSKEYMLANSENSGEGPLGLYTSKDDPNNFSIVAILRLGEFDALLTGDLSPEVNDELAKGFLVGPVEYLKVPHHGSKNGLTQQMLTKVRPQVAVISSGKNNSYGHPHQEILDMLSKKGVQILRTDQLGDVEIETDGKTWWVEN